MWRGLLSVLGIRPNEADINRDSDYADGGTLSGQVERDQRDLVVVQGELATLEDELTRCNVALQRANMGEMKIREGWEELVMETHDSLEFPILKIELSSSFPLSGSSGYGEGGGGGAMFDLVDGALEGVRVTRPEWKRQRKERRRTRAQKRREEEEEEKESDSSSSSSDATTSPNEHNDNDPTNTLITGAVIDMPSKRQLSSNGNGEEDTAAPIVVPHVLDLQRLRPESFVGGINAFQKWMDYKRVWNAREQLTERGCLESLTAEVVTAREELEDKLFHLRLKMLHIRALEVNAAHDLERVGGETEYGEMLEAPPAPLGADDDGVAGNHRGGVVVVDPKIVGSPTPGQEGTLQ